MDTKIDIGCGHTLSIKGLKGFDSKESFISFIESNQKANRIHKNVDPKKAWKVAKKYIDIPEPKEPK